VTGAWNWLLNPPSAEVGNDWSYPLQYAFKARTRAAFILYFYQSLILQHKWVFPFEQYFLSWQGFIIRTFALFGQSSVGAMLRFVLDTCGFWDVRVGRETFSWYTADILFHGSFVLGSRGIARGSSRVVLCRGILTVMVWNVPMVGDYTWLSPVWFEPYNGLSWKLLENWFGTKVLITISPNVWNFSK
jgi:hypothetical protein